MFDAPDPWSLKLLLAQLTAACNVAQHRLVDAKVWVHGDVVVCTDAIKPPLW
jgi:hypothetical protein